MLTLHRASARRATTSLQARLAQLENVIRAHNIEIPASVDEVSQQDATTVPYNPPATGKLPSGDVPETRDGPAIAISTQIVQEVVDKEATVEGTVYDSEPSSISGSFTSGLDAADIYREANHSDLCETDHMDFGDPAPAPEQEEQSFTMPQNMNSASPPSVSGLDPPDAEIRADDPNDDDEITNLLSARMGTLRIAEDGQLRYYGPTSNLHVHHSGFQSLSRSTIRHVVTEGNGVLRQLGLDRKVSSALELHLARLYFSWEDPAIHVVDEETFFMEKQKWTSGDTSSPYYSETLNNAM